MTPAKPTGDRSLLAFISYRRSDLSALIQGLVAQLRARLGYSRVFVDVGSIFAGELWEERLDRAVAEATVVLAVIGPGWLTAADPYGRRRLDQTEDWVRRELVAALSSGKAVIPLLVGGLDDLPPRAALPHDLADLAERQAIRLRDVAWDEDMNELIRVLVHRHGFVENNKRVTLPTPTLRIEPLTLEELRAALCTLPDWEPVESAVPGDYPNSRQEIRRVYAFRSFKAAVRFMQAGVAAVVRMKHHPRWENQWRTVTVHLSTWDIGHRISKLDVELARALDAAYAEHCSSLENAQAT
jgi:pterin-4a-carbinolamine dehydratase